MSFIEMWSLNTGGNYMSIILHGVRGWEKIGLLYALTIGHNFAIVKAMEFH